MKKLLLTFAALLLTNPTAADVYKWVDKDGNVHYGDEQSADSKTAVKVDAAPANSYSSKEAMPDEMKKFLQRKESERLTKEEAAKTKVEEEKTKGNKPSRKNETDEGEEGRGKREEGRGKREEGR